MSRAIVRETPKRLNAAKIVLVSTVKRLEIEQGTFLKREQRVISYKLQVISFYI